MPDQHKVLFTADIHGNIAQYAALLLAAKQEGINSIIIGGDLAPTDQGVDIEKQRMFLESTLPVLMQKYNSTKIPLYLMFGNDDVVCNRDILEKYHENLWYHIEGRRIEIAPSRYVVGYPYVPLTPFKTKDYEKFDITPQKQTSFLKKIFAESSIDPNATLQGYCSTLNGWTEITFNKSNITDTIEDDLKSELMTTAPQETIYVFHSPPYRTALDILPNLHHVGSKAIKQFIETQKPLITLSGHIHDTVDTSGRFFDTINSALCATAGNRHESYTFSYLTFDAYAPQKTLQRKHVQTA